MKVFLTGASGVIGTVRDALPVSGVEAISEALISHSNPFSSSSVQASFYAA
jgi:hypothetical protein